MKNSERFARTISFEPTDRLMTYEVMDNVEILKEYGGFDPLKKYTLLRSLLK